MRKTTNFGKEKWKSARSEEKPLIMGEKNENQPDSKKTTNMREKRAKKKNTSFGYLRRKLGET